MSKIGNSYIAGRRGFTLIEILIAVSILAIGIVGVLRAYSASVTAMENAQYGIDAAYVLKTIMGDIEEKSITQKGTSPGTSSGETLIPSGVSNGKIRLDRWCWSENVQQTDLKVEAKKDDSTASADTKDIGYSLNEVNLTVVNPLRSPARNVSLVTYMESESAES